jgi:hypothetical protein
MHTWGKSGEARSVGISRIVSFASLLIALVAFLLALRKPQPVATPQPPAAMAANAQSFQSKVDQLEKAQAQGQNGAEVRLTSDEISAAIAQASGAIPSALQSSGQNSIASGIAQASGAGATESAASQQGTTPSDPSAVLAAGAVDPGSLHEPIISFEGDQVHGQFLTEVAGKKVYVTISGHLGAKDGYATFQPTEFKVGDLNVPVSLVNDALQKKMLEQRDRLKLPDFVSDVHVENGELVVKQK